LLVPIYPLPQHLGALESNHPSGIKNQTVAGCRIPPSPLIFLPHTEFPETADENVISGFQSFLDNFEKGFARPLRFSLGELALTLHRLDEAFFRERHECHLAFRFGVDCQRGVLAPALINALPDACCEHLKMVFFWLSQGRAVRICIQKSLNNPGRLLFGHRGLGSIVSFGITGTGAISIIDQDITRMAGVWQVQNESGFPTKTQGFLGWRLNPLLITVDRVLQVIRSLVLLDWRDGDRGSN